MARQNPANKQADQQDPTTDEAVTPEAPVAEGSTEGTQPEGTTETPAPEAEADKPVDIEPFKVVVAEVTQTKDSSTGVVPEAELAKITSAYRDLDGAKPKNLAKTFIDDSMLEAVQALDGPLARSFADIKKAMTAGGGSKKESAPADPTAAQVQREASLQIALDLAKASRGDLEGIDEKVSEAVASSAEQVAAYKAWSEAEVAEGAERPEAPETSPVVRAAFKLASGKASGGGRVSGGSGVRRDIGKHISEVFADKAQGTELTVAEIANTATSEYPKETPPSQGAVSARLFPTSGKCTVEGITPLDKTADRPRRAVKN